MYYKDFSVRVRLSLFATRVPLYLSRSKDDTIENYLLRGRYKHGTQR